MEIKAVVNEQKEQPCRKKEERDTHNKCLVRIEKKLITKEQRTDMETKFD